MGIRGDDARIQIQKLSDVDQIDKQRQETQRGDVGAARSKEEVERERKRTTSPELEKPDKSLVRQSPFRKRKQQAQEEDKEEDTEEEKGDKEQAKKKDDVGSSLDVRG